ncbi:MULTISPECIES: hypothetical protein [Pantoea]|uniref:hypothetical protein n=1 Tax=Pantoea TaxID=53335 RepID=UPI000D5CA786|nr:MULTISPECIES: hypothetical protein [Pantoea]MCH9408106.1 hypothetical protein [Pantoea agglomerans]PVY82136.1 hypothetical protein C7427_11237 [Pantoea ananatis]WNK33364.1 hypothetical protein RM157_22920 [Pantoea agglomerans]WNK60694.1 hypothetical protein RM151_22415 [Pantoea agglomerans]WNK65111.1 hypothetical protein RM152_22380 [Pantoea agglomerans]
MSSVEKVIIDFSTPEMSEITLFTGRKNGKKAKPYFKVRGGDYFLIKANDNQVITSSYFLGLIGDELFTLLKRLKDINELIERIDFTGINTTSQDECVRAIKRGLSSNDYSL